MGKKVDEILGLPVVVVLDDNPNKQTLEIEAFVAVHVLNNIITVKPLDLDDKDLEKYLNQPFTQRYPDPEKQHLLCFDRESFRNTSLWNDSNMDKEYNLIVKLIKTGRYSYKKANAARYGFGFNELGHGISCPMG